MIDKFYVLLLNETHIIHIMKSNKTKSREISLTVDGAVDMASSVWNKIRSSKLTIKVDPI